VLTERQRELLAMVAVDETTNRVTYPPDEYQPEWRLLKQVVETLGGVWRSGGRRKKKGGWVFPPEIDAVEAIALARETGEIFDPKLVGYYPTPDALADALVARLDIRPGERVLEPSGGEGALARAVRRACPEAEIVCVELLKPHVAALTQQGFTAIAGDFLKLGLDDLGLPFDVIVMNPPYGGSSRPEIRHVLHALELLKAGGRLGAILPNSLRYRQDAPTIALRSELDRMDAVIEDNARGAFQESGTMVRTVSVWCTRTTRSTPAEAGA
jgi:predicted RNA methylase